MPSSGKQREDLAQFGYEAIRTLSRKAVIAKNDGRLTNEQYNTIIEFLDRNAQRTLVLSLLDSFEPHCDVQRALDELEPLLAQISVGSLSSLSALRPMWASMRGRVSSAINALKGDPRS